MEDRILQLVRAGMSRRTLLKGSLGVAAGVAVVRNLAFEEAQVAAQFMNDLEILNFALTLEHLEARAYREAIASGRLMGPQLAAAQLYGRQEAEHVTLLTGAITMAGGTPVREQARYNFPAFSDQGSTVFFLSTLEDVGVGAYTGAARFIQSKAILAVAGGIVQVEARHAAILRIFAGKPPVPGPLDAVFTRAQVLAQAGPILGA